MVFLQHITGKRERRQYGGSWETPATEELLRMEGMQSADTRICLQQDTVAQWVYLQPLMKVYAQETGYDG